MLFLKKIKNRGKNGTQTDVVDSSQLEVLIPWRILTTLSTTGGAKCVPLLPPPPRIYEFTKVFDFWNFLSILDVLNRFGMFRFGG